MRQSEPLLRLIMPRDGLFSRVYFYPLHLHLQGDPLSLLFSYFPIIFFLFSL